MCETRISYLGALAKFCQFSGKSPQELILDRNREIRNSDSNSGTGIGDLVLDFREYLVRICSEDHQHTGWSDKRVIPSRVRKGMVNAKNYRNRQVSIKKGFVPTLGELKRMLDVSNLEEKFRMAFIAQTARA